MKKIIYTHLQLQEIAQQIIHTAVSKTLCFYGEMGAGKTTLIKAIVAQLKGGDTANSPTFGLVNEYYFANGELLGYHFDFYRINEETEALDMGLEDYLGKDVWIFIEWPEKIKTFLPQDATDIYLEVVDEHTRRISIPS
ncbi:MAG: tRNA (adenosine(37)-N6)-threonylcarbamoyltransferase complex ATPase subunit type 1 TsaE [Saonia sp.]